MAKIKTGEDFINEAIARAFDTRENWTEEQWNEQIQKRFEKGRDIDSLRVTDAADKSLLGAPDDHLEAIKMMNRLDRYIENENSASNRIMAIAARHVVFPKYEQILRNNTLELIKSFRNEIINDPQNTVSDKAIREFDESVNAANKANFVNTEALQGTDAGDKLKFNEIPSTTQHAILYTIMGSFLDRDICRNKDGQVLVESQAMKDILKEVNDCAKDFYSAINNEKGKEFKPNDEREKADYDFLKSRFKVLNDQVKTKCRASIENFSTLENYANMDITPRIKELTLTLDKNPIVKTTVESFVDKQKNGNLTPAEIEWGESNIDYMVEALYTSDELRNLKKAGIDPAMGILVDGKRLDWNSVNNPSLQDKAKLKCEIASKAMQGAKLEVTKYDFDGFGKYVPGETVPVETDLSMKTERRSLWTIISQIFDFIFKRNDKSKQVEQSEYDIDQSKIPSREKREEESAKLNKTLDDYTDKGMKMDIDFFGDIYKAEGSPDQKRDAISAGIIADCNYTTSKSEVGAILRTMGRSASRTNIAIFYGLSRGNSLDDIIADTPEGEALRKQIGRELVDVFKVCKIDEFAKQNKIDPESEETRKQYDKYILGKFENLEKVYAKGCEEFVKLPIPKLDPNNHTAYINNIEKNELMASLAKDIEQVFVPLQKIELDTTNPEVKSTLDRTSAVYNSALKTIMPVMMISKTAENFTKFMKSDDYINLGQNVDVINIALAAKAKSILTYFVNNSDGIETIADLNKNEDLCTSVIALGYGSAGPDGILPQKIADMEAKYIAAELDAPKLVYYDPEKKIFNNFNTIVVDFSDDIKKTKNDSAEFQSRMNQFDAFLSDKEKSLPLSEKLDAIKEYQKAQLKLNAPHSEKISFKELVNTKQTITAKPKEAVKVKEKSLDMNGMKK